jgi:hypothetical protein
MEYFDYLFTHINNISASLLNESHLKKQTLTLTHDFDDDMVQAFKNYLLTEYEIVFHAEIEYRLKYGLYFTSFINNDQLDITLSCYSSDPNELYKLTNYIRGKYIV